MSVGRYQISLVALRRAHALHAVAVACILYKPVVLWSMHKPLCLTPDFVSKWHTLLRDLALHAD